MTSDQRKKWHDIFLEEIKPTLREHGFRSKGRGIFTRAVNDVEWFGIFWRIPGGMQEELQLDCAVSVFSPELHDLVFPDWPKRDWGLSQVSISIKQLVNTPTENLGPVYIYSAEEAAQLGSATAEVFIEYGLPFLEQFDKSKRIVELYAAPSDLIHPPMHPTRREWQYRVWTGQIDATETPYVAPRFPKYPPPGPHARVEIDDNGEAQWVVD